MLTLKVLVFVTVIFACGFCESDLNSATEQLQDFNDEYPEEINDEYSQDECKHCFAVKTNSCTLEACNCTSAGLYHLTHGRHYTNTKRNFRRPQLQCVDQTMVALSWNITENTFYFLEYYKGPPDKRGKKEVTEVTKCGLEVVKKLQPGTLYTMEMHSIAITNSGEVEVKHSRPFTIQTLRPDKSPAAVQNFHLESWSLKDDKYIASIKWDKGIDRACFFDVVWFGGEEDYQQIEITNPLNKDNVDIPNLTFGTNYSVSIMAYSEHSNYRIESPKRWLHLSVPTCHDTYKIGSKCLPDKPKNLSVYEVLVDYSGKYPIYNVSIHWSTPKYPPKLYQSHLRMFGRNGTTLVLNITGGSINATFKNVHLSTEYEILLIAYTEKGPSLPAVVHRHFNGSFLKLRQEESWLSMELIFIVAFPLLILGLIFMFMLNHCLVKRMKRERENKYFKELEEKIPPSIVTTVSTISVPDENLDEWEITMERLIIKSMLGEGAFGLVRKGFYVKDDGTNTEVAIKMLKDCPTQDELKQFYQEIQIMKSVPPHPHLVSLIGCVTKPSPLLVVEYCSKGDLQTYLRTAWDKLTKLKAKQIETFENSHYVSNKLYDFSQIDMEEIPKPKDLISIARQVILGMEYLSSLKLIHRDLAARNVLVHDNNTIKISDFGLSRDVYYDNVYCKLTGGKLPIRWMALESMTHQMYTTQSDVWSFGILLWEIVTMGSTPYPGIPTQDLLPLLKDGYRMEKPLNCSDEIYAIMCDCWQTSPLERPSFTDLRITFEKLLEEVSCYLNLDSNLHRIIDDRYVKQFKVYN